MTPAQHPYDGLPALSDAEVAKRRERVLLVLAGVFLGTLAMLNIIGITRFLDLGFHIPFTEWRLPLPVAVGVLPYPITFLCTDFVSELYGRERANFVVFIGLIINVWVVFILWLGGVLPGDPNVPGQTFFAVREAAFAAVIASMAAYLVAQFVDVQVFHYLKKLTHGRKLWLRNNGSTLISQLVDTVAVILVTHFVAGAFKFAPGQSVARTLASYIVAGYLFKFVIALLDTIPFYVGTRALCRYLRLPPPDAETE